MSILWAWHSGAARDCREGHRETEKINSHRHATLHQDCYCPEREKAGRERRRDGERLFYMSRELFKRRRKIGEWKERDRGERRVVIET